MKRLTAASAALVAGLASLVLIPQSVTAAPAPAAPSQEQVVAMVKPSVVYVDIKVTGYVGVPEDNKWYGPYTANPHCTGFVVDPRGYIATAGHCVDPNGFDNHVRAAFLQDLAKSGRYTQQELANFQQASANWPVEGEDSGSNPTVQLTAAWAPGAGGARVAQPVRASVLEFKPFSDDDTALLKVETPTTLPALEVATADPEVGASLTSVGYPASVQEVTDLSLEPSFKTGRASSRQTKGGIPVTEVDAAVSGGMSGGPTVDGQGRVLGINSFGNRNETQHFNFITSTSRLRGAMARHGVQQQLSPADQAYRAGLDAYFAGRYHAAVVEFDKTLALIPGHAQAQEYRAKAVTNYPNEKIDEGTNWVPIIVIGMGVVTLIAVGAAVANVVLRRRRRQAPEPQPPADSPVMGGPPSDP